MEVQHIDRSKPEPPQQWLTGNVINPAFNELVVSPANILIDAVNATNALNGDAAGQKTLPRMEARPTDQALAGTPEFWAQTAVNGISSALIYAAAGKVTGALARSMAVAPLEGLGLKTAASTLAKEQVQQVVGAAAYDLAREPGQGQTREGDMLGSIAAFSTFGLLNPRLAGLSLAPRLVAQAEVGVLGSAAQIGAGALGGNQVSMDSISQTLATGAFMNIALPGMQSMLGKTIDMANTRLGRGIPLERQMQYASLTGESARLDSLVRGNAQIRVKQNTSGNFEDHQRSSISLSESAADKLSYGEQLGHALAHIQSARWGLHEELFAKAAQALNAGDHDQAWQNFRQARLDEETQALHTGAIVRAELEKGSDIAGSSASGASSKVEPAIEISQQVIPATGRTYEQTWRHEFEHHFLPSNGSFRPQYDYSLGAGAQAMSVAHLQDVFKESGYFASTRQVVQLSASLAAKPVGGAFLFGKAGSGKTFVTELVSKALDAKYFYKQAFPGTREENLLVDILPDQNSTSGVKEYPGVLVKAADYLKNNPGKEAVVVLDEWDKTRPSADSILLDFLQKGRINHGSVDIALTPEEMSRMKVFIALNDERELSEPLLRRLPMIQFDQPAVSVVRQALEFSHGTHPLTPALLSLYQHAQAANMSKPVTIQELRQVIDAYDNISKQGVQPDWDELIKHFISKTEENHILLKRAESAGADSNRAEPRARLDPKVYEYSEPAAGSTVGAAASSEAMAAAMPVLHKLRALRLAPKINPLVAGVDENTPGIVHFNADNYSRAVDLASQPSPDPSAIGDVARVIGDESNKAIVFQKPVALADADHVLSAFWGQPGEVVVTEPQATWQQIKALQDKGLKITEYSANRIVGKADGLDLLWTKEKGAEFLVNLEHGDDIETNPLALLELGDWHHADGTIISPRRERTREGSYEISLGRGLPHARIVTSRSAHKDMFTNNVEVNAFLRLPADESGRLHPDLRFGNEVEVDDEPLTDIWGTSNQQWRERSFVGSGKNWQEATNNALQNLHEDLVKVLQARRNNTPTTTELSPVLEPNQSTGFVPKGDPTPVSGGKVDSFVQLLQQIRKGSLGNLTFGGSIPSGKGGGKMSSIFDNAYFEPEPHPTLNRSARLDWLHETDKKIIDFSAFKKSNSK